MLIDLLLIAIGLPMLVHSADSFVYAAARLARAMAMPAVVIGAVVMGFGTSAPELLVSAVAAQRGELDIGVGNVVGSMGLIGPGLIGEELLTRSGIA